MSDTPSTMMPLESAMPSFTLYDVISENTVPGQSLAGNISVIMFICNHCPFVKHVNHQLVQLASDYIPRKVQFIAISSNDVITHPEDSPDKMKEVATRLKYPFPYLYDETQEVAHAFGAACTPDFYIFDKAQKLVYRGQLDDSRPSLSIPVTGKDIREALNALLNNQPVSKVQKPGIGCGIKWKK